MAYDIQKVIDVAKAEIGYREKASNSNLDDKTANAGSANYTKYARDLDNLGYFYNGAKNGYAWCDVFVDWCFVQAYGVDAALELLCQPKNSAGAGCMYSAQYYQQKGQFHTDYPQVGDQIFFGNAADCYHTGIIESVDSFSITTIEGNSSEGVNRRTYPLSYASIYGYGRPNYGTTATASSATNTATATNTNIAKAAVTDRIVTISARQLQKSQEGNDVKMLQLMLNAKGFDCGTADGEFGSKTEEGVKAFQRANSLGVDGLFGRLSWNKILSK